MKIQEAFNSKGNNTAPLFPGSVRKMVHFISLITTSWSARFETHYKWGVSICHPSTKRMFNTVQMVKERCQGQGFQFFSGNQWISPSVGFIYLSLSHNVYDILGHSILLVQIIRCDSGGPSYSTFFADKWEVRRKKTQSHHTDGLYVDSNNHTGLT